MTQQEIERIELIDTDENRNAVANKITSDLFTKYGMDANRKDLAPLYSWLVEHIMAYPLADAIFNNIKVYAVDLAKKVCSDICHICKPKNVDELISAVNSHWAIGEFVMKTLDICEELIGNIGVFYDEVNEYAHNYEEDDALIIDKTAFVVDNSQKTCYVVKLHIGYHPNYTICNLRKRIEGRIHYQWRYVDLKSIYIEKLCDGTFFAQIILLSGNDLDTVKETIAYRFGKTSGKPWYRCVVADVTEETPANN